MIGPFTPPRRAIPLLVVLCLALFLPGFCSLPPVDRDESRFAQASRQMLETGDFVDIRFQDTPRYKKPVGIYWMQAASSAALGDLSAPEIWTYRVPSLLGAIGAVLLTWLAGSRMFGHHAGLLGAMILATTLLVGFEARQAKTDAVLLLAITGAQATLAWIYLRWKQDITVPRTPTFLFWAIVGSGILVKGPIIVLVSGGTILLLGFWDRTWSLLRTLRPLAGMAIVLAITAPWFVAITLESEGAFFREAVGTDLLGKVAEGQESHGAPPGAYLVAFWFTFWPFALPAALAGGWAWRHREEASVRFCLAWIMPAWLTFEIVITKLPHYVLPVFPAVAILTAAAFRDSSRWQGRITGILEGTAATLAILAAAVLAVLVTLLPLVDHPSWSPGSLAALAATTGVLALTVWIALDRRRARTLTVPLSGAAMVLYATTYGTLLPDAKSLWLSPRVAEAGNDGQEGCLDVALVAAGYHEPSLVFLAGTDTRLVPPRDAARALAEGDPCRIVVVGSEAETAFRDEVRALDVETVPVATLGGFQYPRSRTTTLNLYRSGVVPAGERSEIRSRSP